MLVNNSIFSHQYNPEPSQGVGNTGNAQEDAAVDTLLESQPSRQNNAKLRTAAEEVATTNKEQEIADSLINAIDEHTTQLEAIANWTDGGLNAFKGALEMIAQNMMANKPTEEKPYGSYYEDLFQLVLMDVLANAKEYGLADDQKFMQFLSWSLEYIGTGQHNSWVETLPDPTTCPEGQKPSAINGGGNRGNHLVKIANEVWKKISQQIGNGKIPGDSLTARLMLFISQNGNGDNNSISTSLPSSIYNNLYTANNSGQVVSAEQGFYNSASGGWITENNNHMSPLMRLTLMSYILKDKGELSTPHVNIIMYGSLKEINELYKELFKVSDAGGERQSGTSGTPAENVYLYIIRWNKDSSSVTPPVDAPTNIPGLEQDNKGWQNSAAGHNANNRPNGVTISLDFAGELNTNWLKDLSENYPPRILGDEDIKEINRLGDSAKMIMQTLKYWFQIMRDERVAIARNI